MEGLLIVRSVKEEDGKEGLLVEFEMDFDLEFAPDWLINALMTVTVKALVNELVTEQVEFVRQKQQ